MTTHAFALAAVLLLAAPPAPWDVRQLMHELAQVEAARARFVEVKKVAHFDEPIRTEGVLDYRAPDRLEKHVIKPFDERLIAHGERLAVEREVEEGQRARRELFLDDHPALRPFIVGLRATLAGDLATLERYYTVALSGAPHDWRLTLTPRREAAGGIIRVIRVRGRQARISAIEIVEANGDSSHMTLLPD